MITFSESLIKKIKAAVSIVDVVSEYTELSRMSSGVWHGKCPFTARHSDRDRNPSFTVYEDTNTFYCFGCKAGDRSFSPGSDAIAFICMIKNVGFYEAVQYLANRAGIEIGTQADSYEYKLIETAELYKDQWHQNLLSNKRALSYLYNRGVTDKDIDTWKLGLVPASWKSATVAGRIALPIMNVNGHTVGFGYRTIFDEKPKYINSKESPIFKKSELLYGLHIAKEHIAQAGKVYITEGYMDVISAHRANVKNTVGLMGLTLTDKHIEILSKYTSDFVLAFDRDTAGNMSTLKSIPKARECGRFISVVKMEQSLDLDDYARIKGDSFKQWIESNEVTPEQWAIDDIVSTFHSKLLRLRSECIASCMRIIEQVDNNILKVEYIQRISKELDVPALELIMKYNKEEQCEQR